MRLLTLLAILLAGCATTPLEDRAPAPSSSIPYKTVVWDAAVWAATGHGRYYSTIAATGSMAPLLDHRSVALMEPYKGQPLYVGDWILFDRGDYPNVLHRIEVVTETHVRTSGVNVRWSDGWIPKDHIKARVAGVLYSSR